MMMEMNEWREVRLSDFIDINPRESLPKNTIAKKVAMEMVAPFTKRVSGFEESKYTGGVKFRNGDTIMARITPSLENGKTAFVDILSEGELGFGSTEFLVFREKKDISEKNFIYYLAISPEIRETAVLSMTGSSGRQRVQTDVLKDYDLLVPQYAEQKAIASVLSSLDDKIDLLHRQNETLEQMAEAMFRQWFVEEAEGEWEEGTILQLISLQNGYAFKSKDFNQNGFNGIVKIKNISSGVVDIVNTDFVDEEVVLKVDERFKISSGDILIAMTGAEIGKLGVIPKTDKTLWLNQRVGLLKENFKGAKFLAYLHLKSEFGQDYIDNTATGSAQPNISGSGIESCDFPIVDNDLLKDYALKVNEIYNKVIFNLGQIQTLTQLRDTLLPKLMSGEVRVEM